MGLKIMQWPHKRTYLCYQYEIYAPVHYPACMSTHLCCHTPAPPLLQTVCCHLLMTYKGYAVEVVDGLILAAFSHPADVSAAQPLRLSLPHKRRPFQSQGLAVGATCS